MLAIAGNSKSPFGDNPKDNGEKKKKTFATGITLATQRIFCFVSMLK